MLVTFSLTTTFAVPVCAYGTTPHPLPSPRYPQVRRGWGCRYATPIPTRRWKWRSPRVLRRGTPSTFSVDGMRVWYDEGFEGFNNPHSLSSIRGLHNIYSGPLDAVQDIIILHLQPPTLPNQCMGSEAPFWGDDESIPPFPCSTPSRWA